jgi:8-oxo-dGTP pyrophosphatase MutT (NUDIX family)
VTYELVSRTPQFSSGRVIDVLTDEVTMPDGRTALRDWINHPGAVGVVAVDDADRVLLVRQYRHPVGRELWELPAGLLDVEGEAAVVSAARELAEETDLRAAQFEVLVDLLTTPGASNEAIRIYLARGVSPVPEAERHHREAEELGMTARWVPLDEARDAVLAGRIHNPGSVVGILAACAARGLGWSTLRPADSPWPEHHAYR